MVRYSLKFKILPFFHDFTDVCYIMFNVLVSFPNTVYIRIGYLY